MVTLSMEELRPVLKLLMPHTPCDAVAVGVIDFASGKSQVIQATQTQGEVSFGEQEYFFDLASLTKPLTNSLAYFLQPEAFDEKLLLCLNHRAGLPAWGLLPRAGWEEIITSYPIQESSTLYSDYSALRVMLELRKKGIDQKKICQSVWDKETIYWLDLPQDAPVLQFGYKRGVPNLGEVHDPNAWTIHDFCSHAGLFSTVSGLCRTLLNYEKQTAFIGKVKANLSQHKHRFAFGWDRVENPAQTLAGKGCGPLTFGHLGFTGTSIWIDPEKRLGHVILSNATKDHWYHKEGLNDLRRALGEKIWQTSL